jgi:hypothetical protein
MRELQKNKGLAGFEDLKSNDVKFKNSMVESQETRKMELSMDPSFQNSVKRFREEDSESIASAGNGFKTSSLSFGIKKNQEGQEFSKDAKLPKSPVTNQGQNNALSEKIAILMKENKSMEERIDMMLKEKEKLESSNSGLFKEISALNKLVSEKEGLITDLREEQILNQKKFAEMEESLSFKNSEIERYQIGSNL